MTESLPRLFAWNDWANRETLASLRAGGTPPDRARKLLGHLVGTERLWLSRIEGSKTPPPVWPDLSLEACAAGIDEMRGRWSAYLQKSSPESLARVVRYTNSKGEPWSSTVSDILLHVVMHGGYHRGQIAAEVRAAGFTPAYTDFIEAARRGKI